MQILLISTMFGIENGKKIIKSHVSETTTASTMDFDGDNAFHEEFKPKKTEKITKNFAK